MDVVELSEFYTRPLGRAARILIARRARTIWPDVKGLRVAGLGFAIPYLSAFGGEAERTLALMPARQGAVHWPEGGRGLVALVEETELPLPDASIDRLLLMHSLEMSESLRLLSREVWRVLAPGGRVLAIVPN